MSTVRRLGSALVLCGSFVLGSGPLAADTYYVATSGNDANDGKSPQRAWRTVGFAAAQAKAGDTVYIKVGLYRGEKVAIKNSGTEKAPIIFQGYKDKPGDTLDPKYKPGDKLNPDALPVLESADGGEGIRIQGKRYIEIRNLGLTLYDYGTFPLGSQHLLFENVLAVNLGVKGGAAGGGVGMEFRDCDDCTVRNCVVADAWMGNITMRETRRCLIDNCKSYAVTVAPPLAATDYHIVIGDGQDNIVRDCLAENLHAENVNAHPGHGIGIKDQAGPTGYAKLHSERNKIINCVARNMGEHFYVAHGAHHNEFINCKAVSQWRSRGQWNYGLGMRDGAHDNIFRNCRVEGARTSVGFQDTVEGPKNPDRSPLVQICSRNTLVNCVFADSNVGVEVWNADDDFFKNCVFDNVESVFVLFPVARKNEGNAFRNTIVTNVRGRFQQADKGAGDTPLFAHSNFWANKFEMPAGAGNTANDPLYVNAAKKDFHLKSQAGHWVEASSSWVKDGQTSPCIDAGDPSDKYEAEPQPNGGRIDIGAYGNTPEASKSHSPVRSK